MCFERKMKSETKLNSEHLFELATPEINAIQRMQYFSDTAYIQQYANSITSTLVHKCNSKEICQAP